MIFPWLKIKTQTPSTHTVRWTGPWESRRSHEWPMTTRAYWTSFRAPSLSTVSKSGRNPLKALARSSSTSPQTVTVTARTPTSLTQYARVSSTNWTSSLTFRHPPVEMYYYPRKRAAWVALQNDWGGIRLVAIVKVRLIFDQVPRKTA